MAFRPVEILAFGVLLVAGLLAARAALAGPAAPSPSAASPEEARLTALLERVAGPGRVHVTIGQSANDGALQVLVLVDRAAVDNAEAANLAGLAGRSGIAPWAAAGGITVERVSFAGAGAAAGLAGLDRAAPYLLVATLAIALIAGVRANGSPRLACAAAEPEGGRADETDMALGLIRGWLSAETRS